MLFFYHPKKGNWSFAFAVFFFFFFPPTCHFRNLTSNKGHDFGSRCVCRGEADVPAL